MNWTAIGAVGEILGAVAVIVSLIYLAVQVRHNTESLRVQTLQNVMDRVGTSDSRASSEHVADVLARGRRSYAGLDEADRITFSYYMHERMLLYYSNLLVKEFLQPEAHEVLMSNIRYQLGFPGVVEWLEDGDREGLPRDYMDLLTGLLPPSSDTDADTRLPSGSL